MKYNYLRVNPKTVLRVLVLGISFSAIAILGLIQHKLPMWFFRPYLSQKLTTNSLIVSTNQATRMPVRSIYVKVWGGMAIYKMLEADIQDNGKQIDFLLTIQPNGTLSNPNPATHKYQAVIPQQRFNSFWQQLQTFDAGYLSNAVPRGHRPDESPESHREPTQFVIDAPSYSFTVRDRKQELNHQFQVYAPRFVEDERYQKIVTAFEELVESVFGDRPFSDLTR